MSRVIHTKKYSDYKSYILRKNKMGYQKNVISKNFILFKKCSWVDHVGMWYDIDNFASNIHTT